MPKRAGFTLVELLVVISIIATLSVVGLVSYTNFMKSSRDAKRQSDLRLIQSALEEYYADQLFYPGSINLFGSALTNATGNPANPPVTKTYLNKVPAGATGATDEYLYIAYKRDLAVSGYNITALCAASDNASSSTNKCIKYCLYAKTENFTQDSNLCPNQSGYALEVTSP